MGMTEARGLINIYKISIDNAQIRAPLTAKAAKFRKDRKDRKENLHAFGHDFRA